MLAEANAKDEKIAHKVKKKTKAAKEKVDVIRPKNENSTDGVEIIPVVTQKKESKLEPIVITEKEEEQFTLVSGRNGKHTVKADVRPSVTVNQDQKPLTSMEDIKVSPRTEALSVKAADAPVSPKEAGNAASLHVQNNGIAQPKEESVTPRERSGSCPGRLSLSPHSDVHDINEGKDNGDEAIEGGMEDASMDNGVFYVDFEGYWNAAAYNLQQQIPQIPDENRQFYSIAHLVQHDYSWNEFYAAYNNALYYSAFYQPYDLETPQINGYDTHEEKTQPEDNRGYWQNMVSGPVPERPKSASCIPSQLRG